VLSGLFWIGGTRLLGQALTWAITIVVIRLLSPSDYGLLAMATVFMSCLAMFAEAGLGTALIQAPVLNEDKLRRIFGAVILVDVALFALQIAAAPLVAWFFGEDRLVAIIRVLAVQFLLSMFAVIPSALMSRRLDFKRQSVTSLASSVLGSLASLWMAYSGYGVWALVIGTLLMALFNTVAINIISPSLRRPDFSFEGMRSLVLFGGQVTVGRALWLLYTQADVFIVGKLLGKELLGFYSVSMHLASLPMQKISSIVNVVAYPAFASTQQDKSQTAWYLLKAVRILSFIAFPALWGISSIAPELATVVLGAHWEPAILPLQVLAFITPLRMVGNIVPTAIDGLGRPDIGVWNLIVANAIMLPSLVVASNWGLPGLSVAWGCVTPLVFFANLWRSLPVVNIRIADMLGAMALPALCAVGMYLAVFLARRFLFSNLHGTVQMVALIAAGAMSYALLTICLNTKGCKEIIDLRKR
jgi:O-antigen/teichoic acid export membrane protein